MSVEKQYYNVNDVMEAIGVSSSVAYNIIRQLNEELHAMGKITVRGKVNAKYFISKIEVTDEELKK